MSFGVDMDLVPGCKEKLAYFRIKELKDVLNHLGLSKQGKKQDLVDRILASLSDERVSSTWAKKNAVAKEVVAKLIDDIYRKMQVSGATDLASKSQGVSDSSNVKPKEEAEDLYQVDKIRCPCGSSLKTDSMIKCEDPRCNVWQHVGCVIIPQKPTDDTFTALPEIFYCELCRLNRADPFWVTMAHNLNPSKLTTTSVPTDGTNPMQNLERTFQLTRADKDLLSKQDYDVQAWCILLNDKVQFRMQWPQYADLQVNGAQVRAINRPGSQLLGANGRDDGPVITPFTKDGINKISLTGCDARIFCLGVRIVKRRTVQQILNMIPKESEGEQFEDSLARVRRCIGGGTATENADDSDSDLEVVADSIPVNLRCPMSGSRMKVAGRFRPCAHMGCFDLEVFVEMNQRSRKWQCPICLKNYSLENVVIDPYFNRITSMIQSYGEDVAEIEVKPDGSWRAKADRDIGDIGRWHFPDGTLSVPKDVVVPKVEVCTQIKQECGVSEGHTSLKLGIKKNRNGFWEVSRPEDMQTLSSGNRLQENYENFVGQNIIPMSSSATGSGRDGEDASVNQDGGGPFDFSANNGIELDSISLKMESTYGLSNQNQSAPPGNAEVIVLSDSDEEENEEPLISSGTIYNNNCSDAGGGITYSVPPHGISNSFSEDPTLVAGENACLGLFNTNDDDDDEFGIPLWPLPSGSQAGPGFQLFGPDADVSDALIDLQHGSTSINGYPINAETTTAMGSATLVPDSSIDPSGVDISDGLVDNPLAFGGNDPSLQLFLPTKSSDASNQPQQTDPRNQPDVSNVLRSEDWISLRLGGGGGGGGSGGCADSATTNGLNSRQQLPSRENVVGSANSASAASMHLGMNSGSRSSKASRERSDSPFSFPRQRRSVRPRLYLSIDSESE